MASYKDMLDSAFSSYYARFRELRALDTESAVTLEELFPRRPVYARSGQNAQDAQYGHRKKSGSEPLLAGRKESRRRKRRAEAKNPYHCHSRDFRCHYWDFEKTRYFVIFFKNCCLG